MTEVLKMLPEAAGRGQHFYLFILAVNSLASEFVYATLPLNRLTRRVQFKPFAKNLTSERTSKSDTVYEERCIKEQTYFELLYVSAFSSTVKVSKTVFPV